MKTQIIQDHNGLPTGVFIPIKEWEQMKKKYPDIDDSDDVFMLSEEQKKILESQDDLADNQYQDSDEFLSELKKEYGL